jgi:hypothetical protein
VVETGLVAVYWGPRKQPLDVCARGVHESLQALRAAGYERYFQLGRSRRDALKRPFEPTPDAVRALLARGIHRGDIPRTPIPELGWTLGLWSGVCESSAFGWEHGKLVFKRPPFAQHPAVTTATPP